jgi:predicted TIM-barrel enzyme
MTDNKKQTSASIASQAAATLSDPNASAIAKSLAASALSQSGTGRQTGAEMEDKASRVLASSKYSDDTKTLAGSVVSQSNKKR